MAFRSFWLLIFAIVYVNGEEILFKKCRADDAECAKTAIEEFIAQYYSGNSEYGLQTLDPLIISSIDINLAKEYGLIFHYKNINITGFKNLKIPDFKMDADKESVTIQVDLSIDSNSEVEVTKVQKTFKGPVSANAKFVGTAEYGLSLKEIDGKEYIIVGPETISCQIIGEPTVTVGSELMAAMYKDEDVNRVKSDWESSLSTIRKKILCEIATNGFTTFVNNTRNLAKVLDKNAFILN